MKTVLLIGGSGALGSYLSIESRKAGYRVDVICMEELTSEDANLTYIKHDGKDFAFMQNLVKNDYDVIVDFMNYQTLADYRPFGDLYLSSAKHYFFLSSYRVYAGNYPITEDSPRLLDVEKPSDFVSEYEYSIYKAEEENYLFAQPKKNFTILRPSITFSKRKFQLTILEADVLVYRMRRGKTVILPEEAMDKIGTLTWAGEFGKSVVKLYFNEKAYGEAFTVSTAEHHTWREIAEIYRKLEGLQYRTVDTDTFIRELFENSISVRQQLQFDRCFNRVIDNRKLLSVTGRKQEDFLPLEEALRAELSGFDGSLCNIAVNERMDKLLEKLDAKE